QSAGSNYADCIVKLLNLASDFNQLRCGCLQMLGNDILNQNIAFCSSCSRHISAGLYHVRYNGIIGGMKLLHASDPDHIGAGAFNVGSHTVQEVGHIHHVGFTGCVLDNRPSSGHGSGHHNVDGSAYRHHIQENMTAFQTGGSGYDSAMKDVNRCAKGTESFQMLIDGPAADIAASRKR